MKKLIDEIQFDGTTEITISELRQNPGEVFQQVEMGRSFNVTKRGKVIAHIAKPELSAFELGAAARRAGIA